MELPITEKISNGTTTKVISGNEYTFWNNARVALPYVYKFLKTRYPDSIILPEFNHTDFVVLQENLPVEVQSTIILGHNDSEKKCLAHSYFEQMIEKQIKQNIERYNKCWFFFDSEYFRYLQSGTDNSIRTEYKWFIKYVRDNLLYVFIVSHDGKIKEVNYQDLEFLVNNEMDIDFDKNKIMIFSNVINGHGYTSKEIRMFVNEKRLLHDKNAFVTWLRKKDHSERMKVLGYVLQSISRLSHIDNFFLRKNTNWNHVQGT
ncbi:MAG: hypothetical protein Q8N79_09775, partial [Candidatus Methanoperedens sp.]|nr:hypothetical protein [Candidatus Methanoperedens sp.]